MLTLIHGYGSTGKGGAIKKEVQRKLQYYKHKGRVKNVIVGVDFNSRSGPGRQLIRRFRILSTHCDLNRANPGRVSDHRIICEIQEEKVIVLVLRVGHRSKVYGGH